MGLLNPLGKLGLTLGAGLLPGGQFIAPAVGATLSGQGGILGRALEAGAGMGIDQGLRALKNRQATSGITPTQMDRFANQRFSLADGIQVPNDADALTRWSMLDLQQRFQNDLSFMRNRGGLL